MRKASLESADTVPYQQEQLIFASCGQPAFWCSSVRIGMSEALLFQFEIIIVIFIILNFLQILQMNTNKGKYKMWN